MLYRKVEFLILWEFCSKVFSPKKLTEFSNRMSINETLNLCLELEPGDVFVLRLILLLLNK